MMRGNLAKSETNQTKPSDRFVAEFARSMPESYLATFDDATVELHAGIVHRRGRRATHVEMWKEPTEGAAAICVVADDRPGLLSRICASLVAHDADVIAAQVYGRCRSDGVMEAVDFLWIQSIPRHDAERGPTRTPDISRIRESLDVLVRGGASFKHVVSFTRAVRAAGQTTRVHFEKDERDGHVQLVVETLDHPGVLLAVTTALFREQLQIVSSRVSTEKTRAIDRFQVVELDGRPLEHDRELVVQTAVLEAIEGLQTLQTRHPL